MTTDTAAIMLRAFLAGSSIVTLISGVATILGAPGLWPQIAGHSCALVCACAWRHYWVHQSSNGDSP